ncbi:MAG: efflux RND transporter periplasmic adaptor subunit [Chloroflexota bacterium]|nr:efflux RND transporter periplasmic adaptor subunit [Chloroflexota bacterium]
MGKKWWIVMGAVILVAVLGFAGYSYLVPQQVAAGEPVETVVVLRDTLRVTVDTTGNLVPNADVSLAFLSSGRVTEVLVEVGDVVETGDVLARLDDADAREAVANAEFQVTQAEINLASAQIEAEAGLAQANLDTALVGYEEAVALAAMPGVQLTSSRVSLEQAQDALVEAQEDYDNAWDQARDWELDVRWMKNALENEREATESGLKSAQYNLEVARANYDLAVTGISEESVQNTWAKVLNAQVALESESLQLEQLELSLAQAQLSLESAQRALEETVLVAPAGGTVTELNIQVGEMAGTGQAAVVVISDLATLVLDVNLDETDVAQITVGQEAMVGVDAFSDARLTGEVTHIAPVATTQSGVVLYPVTVRLAPTDLPVRAGMTADVEIVMVSQENALVVPLRAVHTGGGQSYVNLLTDGQQIEQVKVELGVMTDTDVEIVSGLAEGDVVIVVAAPTQNSAVRGSGFGMFGGER